eukprot:scaffold21237_cov121-Isochrysis_galbana.AAC.5
MLSPALPSRLQGCRQVSHQTTPRSRTPARSSSHSHAPRAFSVALVARLGRVGLWGDHHDEVAGQHAHQAHLQRGRQAAVTRPARLRAPRAPGNGYKLLLDLHVCVPGHSAEARHQPCLPPLALDVGLAPLMPPLWPSVEREAVGESLHPHRRKKKIKY